MINYRFKIPRVLRGLLSRPERNIVKMFGVDKVNSQLPRIIKAMIQRNYASKQNEDGSSWAAWSAVTAKLRGRGIARLGGSDGPTMARYSSTMLKATGDYMNQLKNLDYSEMKLSSVDQLWHVNNLAILYIDPDEIPGLWNEFDHKTSGAIGSGSITPARQMLYFDDRFSDEIVSIVKASLNDYWR